MNDHLFICAGGSDDHGDGAGHGGAAERGRVPHPHRGLASGQVDSIRGGLSSILDIYPGSERPSMCWVTPLVLE